MDFIKTNLKKAQKSLSKIEVRKGLVNFDMRDLHDVSNSDPELVLEPRESIQFFGGDGEELDIPFLVQSIREEIKENISLPVDVSIKQSYLKELLDLYSDIEAKIIENNEGKLSSSLVQFVDISEEVLNDVDKGIFYKTLDSIKKALRTEISFLFKQIQSITTIQTKTENMASPQLKWEKSKIDFLELMAALVESKSISENGKPIEKERFINLCSNIFPDLNFTDFTKDLSQAKKRKKNKTPFLNFLVETFKQYSAKKGNS